MSGQERDKILATMRTPNTASIARSIFGWCSLEANCLRLGYITEQMSSNALTASIEVTAEEDPILGALQSLLSPNPSLTLHYQPVYSLSKHPVGVAFVLCEEQSQTSNLLYRLQQTLSVWSARKETARKIQSIRRGYQRQKAEHQHLVDTVNYDKHKLEKRMLYQLSHDSATNMLNRSGLENALLASFDSVPIVNGEAYLSVILVQFTNGERVQARIGCEGWDELLKEFELKVSEVTAQIHYFARISTTELALATVVPSFDDQCLPRLCKQIAQVAKQGFFYQGKKSIYTAIWGS